MANFSKIRTLFEWCFHPDENSKKYVQWAHPIFSFCFGTAAALIPMIKLTEYLEKKFPKLKEQFPEWTQKKLPWALALYMLVLISSRVKYFGPIALYDFLWACNISLLLMIVGLVRQSHLLVSSSMIVISIDQVLLSLHCNSQFLLFSRCSGTSMWLDTLYLRSSTLESLHF